MVYGVNNEILKQDVLNICTSYIVLLIGKVLINKHISAILKCENSRNSTKTNTSADTNKKMKERTLLTNLLQYSAFDARLWYVVPRAEKTSVADFVNGSEIHWIINNIIKKAAIK